jgi:hypothetical protein
MRTTLCFLAVFSLAPALEHEVRAQAPVPVGGEFTVNAVLGGTQNFSNVARDADGDFVVVWESFDGNLFGVFARRFNSAGVAQGGQFQVNTYTTERQLRPVVDLDADGDFVVAWHSFGQDGSFYGVFARRYSAAGAALGAEFMVNTTTASLQSYPSVAADSDGDFVLAWTSNYQDGDMTGIFARRFGSTGAALGGEFRANTYTPSFQVEPSVDREADGDFVVTWESYGQDGDARGIFGKRFTSAGAAAGPEFQVNTTFTQVQMTPAVGVDSDGDFVVVWAGREGSSYTIFGQRFSSTGAPQGIEFRVPDAPPGAIRPGISLDADGDFVVVWEDFDDDGSYAGVAARRFKSSGVPSSLDTRINTTTVGYQDRPSVSARADGDFVVTWTGTGTYPDIFAQRLDVPALIDVDGNGAFDPLTDALLMLRFGFGFSGSTLITGAVGAGCTRCDAPSITAYLQGLL